MALSVAVIVEDIAEKIIKELKKEIQKFKIGLFNKKLNDFGPLVSKEHRKSVIKVIDSAEKEGSKIVIDGRKKKEGEKDQKNGYFLGATLIDNVKVSMKSYKEEIFGPVLQIIRVKTFEDGLDLINKNSYGNGCCIFTSNGKAARLFTQKVNIGMVGINIPLPVPSSSHSFGGWKDSFFGDLSIYGPDGLRFYTQRKTITEKWPESDSIGHIKFTMPTN